MLFYKLRTLASCWEMRYVNSFLINFSIHSICHIHWSLSNLIIAYRFAGIFYNCNSGNICLSYANKSLGILSLYGCLKSQLLFQLFGVLLIQAICPVKGTEYEHTLKKKKWFFIHKGCEHKKIIFKTNHISTIRMFLKMKLLIQVRQ